MDKSKSKIKGDRNYRPGRTSKNNAALWSRREEVFNLYTVGVIKSEIARKFRISPQAVNDDLEAIALLTSAKEVKFKCDAQFEKIIYTCFEKVKDPKITDTARIGYIHELSEAISRKARIHGLDKESNIYNLTQSITNVSAESKYSNWDKEKLQEEFKRRHLKLKSGE